MLRHTVALICEELIYNRKHNIRIYVGCVVQSRDSEPFLRTKFIEILVWRIRIEIMHPKCLWVRDMCSIHFITHFAVVAWIQYKILIFILKLLWFFGCFSSFSAIVFWAAHWKMERVIKIYITHKFTSSPIILYDNFMIWNMNTPKGRTCWEHWNYYYRDFRKYEDAHCLCFMPNQTNKKIFEICHDWVIMINTILMLKACSMIGMNTIRSLQQTYICSSKNRMNFNGIIRTFFFWKYITLSISYGVLLIRIIVIT